MKISGFTILRNISKYGYPAKEAIMSILPICDEFIINVGRSQDNTLEFAKSINSNKIKIIEREWDDSLGSAMLAKETDMALKECSGDWAFYLQADEVIHEDDLPKLKRIMVENLSDKSVDGIQLKWMHFYGSFYRYRVDAPWFQKQVRIIRNNGQILSDGDAWGFRREDGKDMKVLKTRCMLFHYGWVQEMEIMAERIKNSAPNRLWKSCDRKWEI